MEPFRNDLTPAPRLSGLKLVAAYFFAKSAVLVAAASTALISPSLRLRSLGIAGIIAPIIQKLDFSLEMSLAVAFAFAAFAFVLGLGVLERQKWVAGYITVFHGIELARFLVGMLILKSMGMSVLLPPVPMPYLEFEIVSSLFMVAYILRPEVMRSFGFSN